MRGVVCENVDGFVSVRLDRLYELFRLELVGGGGSGGGGDAGFEQYFVNATGSGR